MRVGSVHCAGCRPGSVHVRWTASTRPLASIAIAPVPCVSSRATETLSFASSLLIRFGCSCANSRPPSSVPTMPSALSVPCHASVHLAPAATTPGMAVTVTSRSAPAGPPCCCAPAGAAHSHASSKNENGPNDSNDPNDPNDPSDPNDLEDILDTELHVPRVATCCSAVDLAERVLSDVVVRVVADQVVG